MLLSGQIAQLLVKITLLSRRTLQDTGDAAGILGDIALVVVEIGRAGHHRLGYRLADQHLPIGSHCHIAGNALPPRLTPAELEVPRSIPIITMMLSLISSLNLHNLYTFKNSR